MRNNLKKLVSLLLVCTMLLSLVPSVFAEELEETVEIVMEEVQEIVETEPESEPVVEEPVVEEPVVEEPVVEEPVVEEPVVEEPVVEEPVVEEPVVEEPVVEEPVVEEPVVEEPVVEELVVEEEEPVAEEEMLGHEYLMFDLAEEGWVVTGVVDDEIEEIVVPSEFGGLAVTAIADGAFAGLEKVEKIVVEEGVVSIGSAAFASCEKLALVVLPASLEEMAADAIPEGVRVTAPEGTYAASFITEVETEAEEVTEAPEEAAEEEQAEDYLIMPEALPDAEVIDATIALYSPTYNYIAEVAEGKKVTLYADVITPKTATLSWSVGFPDEELGFVTDNSLLTLAAKGATATVTAKAGKAGEVGFVKAVVMSTDGEKLAEAIMPVHIVKAAPAVKIEYVACPWDDEFPMSKIVNLNDPGCAVYLKASVVGEEGVEYGHEFTWKTSSAANADVHMIYDDEGYLTIGEVVPGTKAGTVTITATIADGSGKSATVKIPVAAVLAESISLEGNSGVVAGGKSIKFVPTFTPANATTTKLVWTVGETYVDGKVIPDANLATISNGTLKAKALTTSTNQLVFVQAALADDPSICSEPFGVLIEPKAVTKVTITGPKQLDVKDNGYTYRLFANVEPADVAESQKNVVWASAKPAIVEIVDTGYDADAGVAWADVTPVAVGTSAITATSVDGTNKKASLSIKVANLATELTPPAGYVAGEPNYVDIAVGQTLKVGTPAYLPADAVKPTLNWFVDDLRDPDGNVIYKGTDYLQVSSGSIKAKKLPAEEVRFFVSAYAPDTSCNAITWLVRIKPAPASIAVHSADDRVSVDGLTATVVIKDENLTVDFDATVIATDGADNEYPDETFTWTSATKAVATIDNDGVLTVLKPGTTKLTVKGVESKKSATLNLTVKAPINDYELNYTSHHYVMPGKTLQLAPVSITPSIATDKLVWEVVPGQQDVPFTVTKDGLVKANTGVTWAQAEVAAYIDGDPSYDYYVIVTVAAAEKVPVTIEGPRVADVNEGYVQLSAYEEDLNIVGTWKSAAAKVATVDAHGLVKLLTPGTAKITFTAPSGATATHEIMVIRAISDAEVITNWEVVVGKKQTITATVYPTDATEKLFWYIDSFTGDEAPVTLDATGSIVTAKAGFEGQTAYLNTNETFNGIKMGPIAVTVIPAFQGVDIRDSKGNIATAMTVDINNDEDGTVQLYATEKNTENFTSVAWTSSNVKVATVDENGVVTLVGAGSANIVATASNGSGQKATLKLTVVANANGIASESEGEQTLLVGKTATLKVKATTEGDNTTKQNKFFWTVWSEEAFTSREQVVTVANGKVTAKAPGKAVVLAFVDEGEYNDFVEYMGNQASVMSLKPEEIEDQLNARSYDGQFAIFNFTVYDVPTKVFIDEGTGKTSVKVNKNTQNEVWLSYEVQNKLGAYGCVNPAELTWTSSNPAAVDFMEINHEEAFARLYINPEAKAGTVTITAATNDGANKKGTFKITTYDGPHAMWVEANSWNHDEDDNCVIVGGEKLQLTARVMPGTVKNTVKWSVDADKSIATISSSGLLTTKPVSEVVTFKVIATSTIDPSFVFEFGVKMLPTPTQVKLECTDDNNPAHLVLKGEELKFSTNLTADEGAMLICTSSDWGIAEPWVVFEDGKAYLTVYGGEWGGHAEISVWMSNDPTNADTVQVLVADAPSSVAIEGPMSLTNGAGAEYVAHVLDAEGSDSEGMQYVTWYLSDENGIELTGSALEEAEKKVKIVDDNIYDNVTYVKVQNIVVPEAGDEVFLAAYSDIDNSVKDVFMIALSAAAATIEVDADKEWIDLDEGKSITLDATITPSYARAGVEWSIYHPELPEEEWPEMIVSDDSRTVTLTAVKDHSEPFTVTAKAVDGRDDAPEATFDLFVLRPADSMILSVEQDYNPTHYMADSQTVEVFANPKRTADNKGFTAVPLERIVKDENGNLSTIARFDGHVLHVDEVLVPTTVYVQAVMKAGEHEVFLSDDWAITIYPEMVASLSSDQMTSEEEPIVVNISDKTTVQKLNVTVNPAQGACPYVVWVSEDESVATVEPLNEYGTEVKIVPHKEGKVILTARSADYSPTSAIGFPVEVIRIDYAFENVEGGLKLNSFIGDEIPAELEIPSSIAGVTVKELGEGLFKNQTHITKATLPTTVTKIPASLFEGCTALETVVLSDNVTVIGQSAFAGCTSLGNMVCVAD